MTVISAIKIYLESMQKRGEKVKSMALALKPNAFVALQSELIQQGVITDRFSIDGVTVGYCLSYEDCSNLPEDYLFNSIFK